MGTGAARDFTSSGARASALAELAPTNLSIQVDLDGRDHQESLQRGS